MHGCGNDYIYVNAMENDITDLYAATTAWSDRHKGIGSDGLVLIDKATVEGADFSMRIFNADGSEAMMCGNASRCIGKYLYERGLTDKTEIHLQTLSGIKTLRLSVSGGIVESVTVDMLEPAFEDEELFTGCDTPMQGTFVSMGNPHYVIFTNTIDQVAGIVGNTIEGEKDDAALTFILLMKEFMDGSFAYHQIAGGLKNYILEQKKVNVDWMGIEVLLTGSDVPGEGEHKILEYIRNYKLSQKGCDFV